MPSGNHTALRVLLIEDSEPDAALMMREIESHGHLPEYERVETEAQLRSAFLHPWDIVLSDFRLPQLDAFYALDILKELALDIPFIVVSQAIGEDQAVQIMRSGASDYIMKSSLKRLVPAIERELRDAADRRSSAQKLRDHEGFLESVIQNQQSGTIVVGPTGEIRLINRSAEIMLQMRRDDTGALIDDTWSCYFVDMENNRIEPDELPIARALREKKKVDNMQFGVVFARGNMKWLSASASPLTDGMGKVTGAVGSYLDITEIIETQRRNRFQLQQLRLQEEAINNSKNGVIIADARLADMPVIYVNKAFTDITGYESHEVLGRNCRFLHASDKEQAALSILRRAISTAQSTEVLLRNFRKDGKLFYSKLHLSPVLNEAGQVAYFVAVQTDVTDKFLIDKQIELSWERMQLALRGARLGLIDVDYETNETYYSSRFAEIVGYTSAELSVTISSWRDLVHPDDLESAQQKTEDHLAGKTDQLEAEVRFHHKNGSWIWILCRGKVVDRGPQGPRRFIGTILDINERKENERKIHELTQDLMRIAEVERAEISGELHDVVGQSLVLLKLNVIRFLQENALRNSENEHQLIEPISDTLQKVRDISRRLTPSHMQKVGLGLALEDMLQSAMNLSGVQITWNLNALEDFFSGNWDIQAFRIVQEALTNALKHASASLIRVETRRLEGNLEIRIEDNGKGFTDAEKDEGLGLSILRERVRGLRGHIFWESGGQGTSVHILLPGQGASLGNST